MHEYVCVWKWTLFRLRSFWTIICHFNEKRAGRMWCVDDIWWPNVDKSATFTVTLLKQWRVASIEIDLVRRERLCCSFFFCLEFTEMFNNPFFSAYATSGEKQQSKEEIKENLKLRLRKFWGTGSFHTFFLKEQEYEKDWKSPYTICRIQSSCSGIHIS